MLGKIKLNVWWSLGALARLNWSHERPEFVSGVFPSVITKFYVNFLVIFFLCIVLESILQVQCHLPSSTLAPTVHWPYHVHKRHAAVVLQNAAWGSISHIPTIIHLYLQSSTPVTQCLLIGANLTSHKSGELDWPGGVQGIKPRLLAWWSWP